MTRRPVPDDSPAHLVLDNEGLGQLVAGRLSGQILLALEFAKDSGGQVLVPASVVVERNFDRRTPRAAHANRILRGAELDPLTDARAAEAVALRVRSTESGSVVDAHVAASALAVVRRHGGTATVATSDPADISRLLDGAADPAARAVCGVLLL